MHYAVLPELLREFDIGVLNTTEFRVVLINTPATAKESHMSVFPLVHLKCVPKDREIMDLSFFDKSSLTTSSILDLLTLKKQSIIERFLPSSHLDKVFWLISVLESNGITQITINAGQASADMSD